MSEQGAAVPDESDTAMLLRVVVIDDHALFRQGVVAAIGDSVDVVGEADDVDSGIQVVRDVKPDVVLLDVHLTSGSGGEIIDVVGAGLPETRFLALSVSDSPEDVLGLVRSGARGYVTKRIDGDELVESIRNVAAGNAVFSPRLAGFVLDAFSDRTAVEAPSTELGSGEHEVDRLTPREHEIMQFLARGYAHKEIAAELVISVRTVESHASSVLHKLQFSNRHELTHWAIRKRIV